MLSDSYRPSVLTDRHGDRGGEGEGEQVDPHKAAAASIDCPGAGQIFAFRQQHCRYLIGAFGGLLCHSLCPSCGSAERKVRSAMSSSCVAKCAMLLRLRQMSCRTTMARLSYCLGGQFVSCRVMRLAIHCMVLGHAIRATPSAHQKGSHYLPRLRLRGCEQLDSAATTVTGPRPIRS